MFIYGLKSLTESAYQFTQESYNKTAEYAKSIFEALNSAVSSSRSIRIYTAVVLTWTISLGLPVAQAQLGITDKCCSPGFFGHVLLSTCRKIFNLNFQNSEMTLNINRNVKPIAIEVNCGNCFLSAEEFLIWSSDIKRVDYQNGNIQLIFRPNVPIVNVVTNCTLPYSMAKLEGEPDTFVAIVRYSEHLKPHSQNVFNL